MGLFSRNEPTSGSASRSRVSMSSEAQAAELRGRARRRLIGALALVLAAVIVVPLLFDPSTPENTSEKLIVVPAIAPPVPDPNATATVSTDPIDPGIPMAELAGDPIEADQTSSQETPIPITPAASTEPAQPVDSTTKAETVPSPAQPEPVAKVPEAPKPAPKPDNRTDDGSVAIALLEGRAPNKPAAAAATATGSFTLQIAAYTADKDAQQRREKLVSAGVTNAYVEHATVDGKNTYRLRVGPFPTRDAAQAAQARLRALGYDNSFISTK